MKLDILLLHTFQPYGFSKASKYTLNQVCRFRHFFLILKIQIPTENSKENSLLYLMTGIF